MNLSRPNNTYLNLLEKSMVKPTYDPENGINFDAWCHRFDDMFVIEAAKLDNAAKTRLLL